MKKVIPLLFSVLALLMFPSVHAGAATAKEKAMQQEIDSLRTRVEKLENMLQDVYRIETAPTQQGRQETQQASKALAETKSQAEEPTPEEPTSEEDTVLQEIKVGGAVRFQYTYERYNEGNKDRGGDLDFDIFRINLDGKINDVLLSAEWRWYQYMNTVHHAWVGYDFNSDNRAMVGITKVPFGVLPFDSHNFFFSSNYYLGLEDDYDAGLNYRYTHGPLDIRLAYYLNDEQGGVDGYVDNRSDRYSYDVVGYRVAGEGIFDTPSQELGEQSTWNGRVAYTIGRGDDWNVEFGLSGRYGQLDDGNSDVGDYNAYAVHMVGNYGRWNLQLQVADYEYDLDAGADLMVVGAYSFFDTIPAKATTFTGNIAYALPVDWGPVNTLTFYNDYSLVTDKSADLADTWMNVTGVAVAAGAFYTYIDFVTAENQPFIGGSFAGDSDSTEHRFNINFGYYF